MTAEMFEKADGVLLPRCRQQHIFAFKILGELQQIALIGRARQWTQPFLHAQIHQIFTDKPGVASCAHYLNYLRSMMAPECPASAREPNSSAAGLYAPMWPSPIPMT